MYENLGAHLIAGTNIGLGHPWGVKAVNCSVDYIAQLRRDLGPDSIIWIRFEHDDPRGAIMAWPEQAARDWFTRRLPDMEAMRRASGTNTVFELPPNEPPTSMLPVVVRFYRVLLALCYGHGFRVAVGNPSVGEWHEDAWVLFAPILQMLHPGSYLSCHEYWRSGADLRRRWLTGRWAFENIGDVIGDVPVVVSECGRDGIIGLGDGEPDGGPWLDTSNQAEYLEELRQYSELLGHRRAFVFTLGNDPKWARYSLDSIWPSVVAGYNDNVVVVPQPPEPAEEYDVREVSIVFEGRMWTGEVRSRRVA